jgi:hypothetical protein
MAYTNFRIGNTSGSASSPDNDAWPSVTVDLNKNLTVQKKRTVTGELRVNYIGQVKRSFGLEFQNKTKTTKDAIEQYCDVPEFYYVILEDGNGVKLIDGFCFLTMTNINPVGIGQDIRYNFSVVIDEI